MLKVVVDSNVLVSGTILSRGHPFEILEAWRRGEFILVTSREVLAEVEAVLRRPKIFEKYRLTEDLVARLLAALEHDAIIADAGPIVSLPDVEPHDVKFLVCAEAGVADYLVTGDLALLKLRAFRETRIVDPATFTAILDVARRSTQKD
ncbi:MAG: putative toxin-antitoxin system toxin component, PIN family [Candidatus Methylomirabilaceae bacterium]